MAGFRRLCARADWVRPKSRSGRDGKATGRAWIFMYDIALIGAIDLDAWLER